MEGVHAARRISEKAYKGGAERNQDYASQPESWARVRQRFGGPRNIRHGLWQGVFSRGANVCIIPVLRAGTKFVPSSTRNVQHFRFAPVFPQHFAELFFPTFLSAPPNHLAAGTEELAAGHGWRPGSGAALDTR